MESNLDIVLDYLEYDIALREPKPEMLVDTYTRNEKIDFHKWEKENRMSIMIIRGAIPDAIRGGIPIKDTAKELMEVIQSKFMSSVKSMIGTHMGQPTSMRYNDEGSVRDHILEMEDLVYKLRGLDMNLNDDFLVQLEVNSLPKQFETFKVNYNTCDRNWNVNELIAHCVQEEERQRRETKEYAHFTTDGPNKKDFKKSEKNKKPQE
ncbi:uncharacterized protein LOC113316004 [Papaver somniferum]|uniref:uncharacterized protein LOC113316004 n=1 Tax=Papaver somniferum TaxID=3469 RepID=UPI000E6F4A55|nr:uncharacterized protein LOC113316004 [Papaver somniferum]